MKTELDEKTLAILAATATATLTTVLLKKGLRNVWLRGTTPLRPGQKRLVGPAFTLRFVPAREDLATPESWSSPVSTRAAIEAMPAGCIAVVISMSEGKPLRRILVDCYFWSFPYYLVGAGVAGAIGWFNREFNWETSLLFVPAIYIIYRSYRLYLGKLEDEKRHVEEMADLHLRTIEALALAIEAKDQTTGEHLQRVRVYAMELAKELRLTEDETEALRAASVLHDIGKLAVPEHIINKPGRLTPEEFEKMKVHPLVGAEILDRVAFP